MCEPSSLAESNKNVRATIGPETKVTVSQITTFKYMYNIYIVVKNNQFMTMCLSVLACLLCDWKVNFTCGSHVWRAISVGLEVSGKSVSTGSAYLWP